MINYYVPKYCQVINYTAEIDIRILTLRNTSPTLVINETKLLKLQSKSQVFFCAI